MVMGRQPCYPQGEESGTRTLTGLGVSASKPGVEFTCDKSHCRVSTPGVEFTCDKGHCRASTTRCVDLYRPEGM